MARSEIVARLVEASERRDDDVTATSMRTHMCGELRVGPGRRARPALRLGGPPARPRGAPGLRRPARPHRHRPVRGGRQRGRAQRMGDRRRRHGAGPARGHGQRRAGHGRDRAGRLHGGGAGRGRAAAVPGGRPGRDRRGGAPALPLRRHAPAPHAGEPAPAGPGRGGHAGGHGAPGLLRGRDAAAVDADPGGAHGSSPCPRGCTTATSTCCPRAPRSPSSC